MPDIKAIQTTATRVVKLFGKTVCRREDYDVITQRDIASEIGSVPRRIGDSMDRYLAGDAPKSVDLFIRACAGLGMAPVFVPRHHAEQAEVDFCRAGTIEGVAKWAVAQLEAKAASLGETQTGVGKRCGSHQPAIKSMVDSFKSGKLPHSTMIFFGIAFHSYLVPVFVDIKDLSAVVKTFDVIRDKDLAKIERQRAQAERTRVAANLVELKAWKEAWPEHPSFEQVNAHGKLTLEEIAYIRGTDDTLEVVAEKLGIVKSTASYVRNGISWPAPFPDELEAAGPSIRSPMS